MKAAVIITVHNHWGEWGDKCLASVIRNTTEATDLLVFDNQSDEPVASLTAAMSITRSRITLVRINDQDRMGGLTGTWNMGIAMAIQQGCDRVVLLNHDTVVDETFRGFIERIGPMSCHGPESNCPSLPGFHEKQWALSRKRYSGTDTGPTSVDEWVNRGLGLEEVPEINGFCMGIGWGVLTLVAQQREIANYFEPRLPFAGNENEFQEMLRMDCIAGKIHVDHDCFVFHHKAGEWRE